MKSPEKYNKEFPEEPDKALAARIIDADDVVRDAVSRLPLREGRAMRIDRIAAIVRVWLEGA